MKSHSTEQVLPATPRFHVSRADGLYQPIVFFLVTERMRGDIEVERKLILNGLPPELHHRQAALFARYDPERSVRAFEDILRMFGVSRC